jgi:hypothetical protein
MVLWTEDKEEQCQGKDTARSRLSMPCDKSKGARRSAKFVERWEYRRRRFTAGSGGPLLLFAERHAHPIASSWERNVVPPAQFG